MDFRIPRFFNSSFDKKKQKRNPFLMSVAGTLLVLLVIVTALCSRSWTQCWDESGDIKKRVGYHYKFFEQFGEHKRVLIEWFACEYNKKGDVTLYAVYDTRGDLKEEWVYEYDDRGNEIGKADYGPGGRLERKYIYKYDEDGNKTEGALYDSQGRLEVKTFYYYGKGERIREVSYSSEGELFAETLFSYDDNGNMIETLDYNPEGQLRSKNTLKYDEKGNITEQAHFNDKGKMTSMTVYRYDEGGNKVEQLYYRRGQLLARHLTKYNKNRQKTEVVSYDSKGLWMKTTYTYNFKGNCSERMEYIYKFAFGELQEIPAEAFVYEYEYEGITE